MISENRMTRRFEKIAHLKKAKIYATKLNLKAQNIYIKPL
jgi:hypothetical protein